MTKASKGERARAAMAAFATTARTMIAKLEPTDVSYFVGLLFLHDGLRRTFGLGQANIAVGAILVITPLALIFGLRQKKG